MSLSSRGPERSRRLTAEGQIHWLRGAMIVAGMIGVGLIFWIVLSLLQSVAPETPQIRGLVTPAAAVQPAAATSIAAAAPQATPVETPTAPPSATGVTATAREAPNVHSGAGVTYPVLTNLVPGQTVEVIGRSPDSVWIQVRLANGVLGWASANLCAISGNLTTVPVTQ